MATATRVAARAHTRAEGAGLVVAVGAVLVAVAAVWGARLDRVGHGIGVHAAPLFGAASNRLGAVVIVPVGIACLLIWRGKELAERLDWRHLLAGAFFATIAWGIALALVDHGAADGLLRGVRSPFDFLANVQHVGSPGTFVDQFVERIEDNVVHVRGHPPALVVTLWWMQRIGLAGAVPLALLAMAAGGVAVVAALYACREVAGEAAARRAAPFLVMSPAAIWLVTSADAIYAGMGAAGAAAIVVATGRRSDTLSAIGGLLLGAGLFMSYGLLLLLVVPCAVAIARRHVRPLVVAGLAMTTVGAVFAMFGFSWIDGALATRAEYAASIAAARPYGYFLLANIAAFAIVIGPGPLGGLGALRDRRVWLLVGAALAAVLAADLSGMSKGEVERIWLPFWPWAALAAAGLSSRIRMWLGAQAVLAIGIQTFIGTPW
ncbi:MAG TPA: hypothetical protein VFA34_16555 [Actinomycetota bacterium]|jgi:hypothetical protein|nr:hypothetical protein [Actinomycetota bacterium]